MKKSLFSAVLATLLLAVLTLGAMSAARTETAQLWYNDIKITLDGEKLDPTDATGNTVSPFIIDGTTYLPVRAVAQAVDLDVAWDDATNTVKLSGNSEVNGTPVYSRKNPAPLGVSQTVMVTFENGKRGYVAEVKVTETMRGKEALKLIRKTNPYVEIPGAGMEYLVARASITLLQNNAQEEYESSYGPSKFTFVLPFEGYSSDGKPYKTDWSVMNANLLLDSIFENGQEEAEGYTVFIVSQKDSAPVALYGTGGDYTGSAWFSLAES